MDDAARRAALLRHWEYEATDKDVSHELYHEDAVLEFPQSRERFEGRANFVEWRKRYPANVEFKVRQLTGAGELWVAETALRYDGGPWHYGCSILTFRGNRVIRERIYIGESWEAPAWRAPWRAEWREEAL